MMASSAKIEMASPESKDLVPFTRESLEQTKQHIAKKRGEEHKEDLKPNDNLTVGKELPLAYGTLLQEMVSEPLEDVDPYYKDKKIFMILNKNRTIFRFNASWFTLSPFSPIRRTAIKILVHPLFRLFILISVLIDCTFMTMTAEPEWLLTLHKTLLGIYVFEIIIKIAARGIGLGSFYFFGDPWNCLDFIITVIEIEAYASHGFFSVCIEMRNLRILKIIPLNQGIRSFVGILNKCVRNLRGVIILNLLFLHIFSIIGMNFFMGQLRHKCVRWPQENETESLHNKTGSLYHIRVTESFYYLEGETSALLCGNNSDAGWCPEGFVCVQAGDNPDYGYTSFDNFFWAFLAIFRLMTQDYPEALYHQVLYTSGKSNMVFFIVVSFWFAFYLASLYLGIIAKTCKEEMEKTAESAKMIGAKFHQTLKDHQEENESSETKSTQIEMKNRSPASVVTTLDMGSVDDATLQHEAEIKKSRKGCPLYWYKFAKTFLIWDCCPCWIKLKEFTHKLIMNPFTDLFLAICIIVNIYFLALEQYPMSDEINSIIFIENLIFLGIITAEMIFKIIAMHPYGYFQVRWNIFDCLVVFIGLADLFLVISSGLPIFLILRLLQIFKVGKYWPTFQLLMRTLRNSLMALKDLILLLFVFMFFSAIIGLKFFGSSYQSSSCNINIDCQHPRWHMNDFLHSFMNVFRILCGEWIETLWDCFNVVNIPFCLSYYMMIILIGNLLLFYLFMGLVISFTSYKAAATEVNDETKNLQLAMAKIKKKINYVLSKLLCKNQNPSKKAMDSVNEVYVKENISGHTLSELSNASSFPKDKDKGSDTEKNTMSQNENQSLIPSPSVSETVPIASGESDIENLDNKEVQSKSGDGSSKEKIKLTSSSECSTVDIILSEEEEMLNEHELAKRLKNYGQQSSPDQTNKNTKKGKIWQNIRKTCCKIVENSFFKWFICFVTLISTGTLALEDIYIDQRKTIKILLEYADMIFTYIFILEMLLKWMAYGFKAYFKNGWYRLDFLVVIVFCVTLIGKTREDLKPLVSIKFLRALRVLSQFEEMKVVIRALLKTTLPVLNVFLFCLMIWLTFSIMGVYLFSGKFYKCINPKNGKIYPISDVMNKSQCESLMFNETMSWKNAKLNFDNVGNGFLSLLQVATFNGWIDIMNSAIDSRNEEMQPSFEDNIYMYYYFVIFIIIGLFLPLSMLTGAIVANFNKLKIKQEDSQIFITVVQKKQYRSLKKLIHENYEKSVPRPRNKFRGLIFDLVTSRAFNIIIMVLICVYAIICMTESYDQSIKMDLALMWINLIFTLLYFGECVLKIIAFQSYYFTSRWNIFDFMIVILSFIGIFVRDVISLYFGFVNLALLWRIIHFLRPTRGPKVLNQLLHPLLLSLPALLNISFLIFLLMFVYAIFGMYNFAYVKKEAGINDVSNFETFGSSMLCLFQVTIFAGWDGMLNAMFNSNWSDCDPDKINPGTEVRGDCVNPLIGIIYFVSYILISWLIIVNMYIVFVMEFLNIDYKKKAKTLSEEDFRRFFKVWKRYDPYRTQYIDSSKLSDFAAALDPPLSIEKPNKGQLVAMDLPMAAGDRIHCLDILLALTKRVMGQDGKMEKVLSEIESEFMSANPFKITYEPITTTLKRKQEAVSATIIQRAYKSYRLRQNDKNASGISGIQMIDDDRKVQTTKDDACLDNIEEHAAIQNQI